MEEENAAVSSVKLTVSRVVVKIKVSSIFISTARSFGEVASSGREVPNSL
jgi:hypothetical protein